MIRSKRWAGALLVLLVACLYFPLNRLLTSGYNLQTALDAYIPIVPLFVVPYLLCLPYWLLALGVAAWKMDDALYRASIFGALAAIGTAGGGGAPWGRSGIGRPLAVRASTNPRQRRSVKKKAGSTCSRPCWAAKASAPGPIRKTWGDFSITARAAATG